VGVVDSALGPSQSSPRFALHRRFMDWVIIALILIALYNLWLA
jgi:hypothetical protein